MPASILSAPLRAHPPGRVAALERSDNVVRLPRRHWAHRGARLAFVLAVGSPCAADIFPAESWAVAAPASQGIDAARLAGAIDYLRSQAGRDGVGELVVVRRGVVIWQGDATHKVHGIWSATKSFTSTCLGLLIDDGRCTLDTRAKDFVPALAAAYPAVTLRHFATMTSGYRAIGDEPQGNYRHGPSRTPFTPDPQPLFAPGAHFCYWDSAMNQFGQVLTRIAGEPLDQFFKRRIADPIGMDPAEWHWGHFSPEEGQRINGGSGNHNRHVFISARQLARLGLLFLHRGRWNGRQLLSPAWIEQATSVQVPAHLTRGSPDSRTVGSGIYGFNWWVNGRGVDGALAWPEAPPRTFAAMGHNNNVLFVVPEWDLVFARLGLDSADRVIGDARWSAFLGKVGQALTDSGAADPPRAGSAPAGTRDPARAVIDVPPTIGGEARVAGTVELSFAGPAASVGQSDPNPFLDYRLQVAFTAPSGQRTLSVPGFFDGDGRGGAAGSVWRVRFTPDEAGTWRYRISFRRGPQVAVALEPDAGTAADFDGRTGSLAVAALDPAAPGFRKWGRLQYVGGHYLKFQFGPYWVRGGADSPEDFLGYAGFDHTPSSHHYSEHVSDWRPGDPDWGDGKGRGIIGALNSLAEQHVNSLYFLTHNIGGDFENVWPWAGSPDVKGSPDNDNLHFDVGKLRQWELVFDHAQRRGIFLHFVLNEAEAANKRELDDGELGPERKLYYRELIARFGHHLALQWNLCEEYNIDHDLGPGRVQAFAEYVRAIDPYGHPVTVHSGRDALEALQFMFGDERFSLLSVQLGQDPIDTLAERLRTATARAGRPLPVSMDEFTVYAGQAVSYHAAENAELLRVQKLWPTYLSGGNIEFILPETPPLESFKTPERARLWRYVWYARRFLESLPFWEMEPADSLLQGADTLKVVRRFMVRAGMQVADVEVVPVGKVRLRMANTTYEMGAQVFALPGRTYAIYLPSTHATGSLDLSAAPGDFQVRWYDPRRGEFVGAARLVAGGARVPLGPPPAEPGPDWTVLVQRAPARR